MTKELEALRLALEALEKFRYHVANNYEINAAIAAAREVLAQTKQEPVAYTTGHCENHKQKGGCQLHNLQCGWPDCDHKPITTPPQPKELEATEHQVEVLSDDLSKCSKALKLALETFEELLLAPQDVAKEAPPAITAIKEALAQTKQEPVAYLCENAVGHKYFRWKKPSSTYKPIALYTTPPQRTWVGLTDEEKQEWIDAMPHDPQPRHCMILVNVIEAKLKERNT